MLNGRARDRFIDAAKHLLRLPQARRSAGRIPAPRTAAQSASAPNVSGHFVAPPSTISSPPTSSPVSPASSTTAVNPTPVPSPAPASPPTQPPRAPRDEDVSAAMATLMNEYGALRSESLQAMNAQQTILTWSLAAFGGVLAAGLLLATSIGSFKTHKAQDVTFLLIFSAGLPGLSFASCLAWFGELIRMERVGHYIRGVEIVVSDFYQSRGVGTAFPYLAAPLRWETYIAFGARSNSIAVKRQMGYFGHLLLYAGSLTLSLSIGCIEGWVFGLRYLAGGIILYSVLVLLGFVAVVLRARGALLRGAAEVAGIDAVVPSASRLAP